MTPVAVIIPVYNTQATLARCIDSVLAQTVPASQVIIVDDGSPDEAVAVALDYATRHTNIKVVRQENRGLAEARRTGIAHATAPLIMHLDSDDTLPTWAIEFLHDKITSQGLDIAFGCFERIPQGGTPYLIEHPIEGVLDREQFVSYCLGTESIKSSCCSMSRRSLWTSDVWPEATERIPSEDILINLRLAFNAHRVGLYNHPTYCYYYNPQSLSIAGTLWQLDRWKQFFALMEKTLTQHNALEQHATQMHALAIDLLAFSTHNIDPTDPWVKALLNTHYPGLSRKTRLLQRLLRHPRLLHTLITLNRHRKRLLG